MPRKMPAPADAPKPRGRPPKTHNQEGSDTALQSQLREVRRLKLAFNDAAEKMRTANGVYRSAIKTAVACGKHLDLAAKDVTRLMDLMDREPEDIDRETARMNRLAKLMNLPLGSQLGLFEDGETVATAIEKAAADPAGEYDPTEDEEAGYQAFGAKAVRDDNPHEVDAHRHHAWERGFMKAEQDFLALERSGV